MKEIVKRLHENRQIELAKSILESEGYKVENSKDTLTEGSALDKFWELYDRDVETAEKLDTIARKLGISTTEEPSEEEARRIIAELGYDSDEDDERTIGDDELEAESSIVEDIMGLVEDLDYVRRVESFEDVGLMTKNKGFVVTTVMGNEYQFELLGSW